MSLDLLRASMNLTEDTDYINASDRLAAGEIADIVQLSGTGPCSLDRHPGKSNWVEDNGGLPNYICHIARAIHKDGMPVSQAIAIAVGRVKKWAAGVGDVDADTRAKASKAVSQWEALKAKAHAKKG